MLIVKPLGFVSLFFDKTISAFLIDKSINNLAFLYGKLGKLFSRIENGNVRFYALYILFGVVFGFIYLYLLFPCFTPFIDRPLLSPSHPPSPRTHALGNVTTHAHKMGPSPRATSLVSQARLGAERPPARFDPSLSPARPTLCTS